MSRYERSPLKPLDENEFKEIKDNYKMLIDRFRDLVS